ncbi:MULTISPECIES: FAD:protein FMN transferase [unclassified Lentimonas]|uniref:FAD:protein FMN transferase n=1 Tax=unclassified Lentimonas TaxID=2630993 RepID=UPI0013229405|nr:MULTISPECIES: FAD:protein FMN transferase [unclassified Lentimonas]CAA6677871.1 Thiamin biosynthesis lipoprotein ApbE [Lentimonas sp. CC4]CAA6683975.1 Thiamin biosynthesis lipoprotein ApbE [Lentimonas sp. CC6]CAA7076649.1 Thiamin biosynthesis lipoprotein ApbE [Lentimonas sp. CC4]CAA7170023.1 Thiamin biosynthesis lipoprotein ApbE [Lentimonas sp. CC21]CAA7181306.1 Thiamin biosynthesis lipoprotein ApbE [Lentimonas sp. CC8]
MSNIHQFDHNAMKCTFVFRIVSDDEKLAHTVAYTAITLLDEIENTLSRYIEGSDVFRINHMETGQTLLISDMCYDCIRQAAEAHEQTGGLFDITLGTVIEHQKNELQGDTPTLAGKLSIDPNRPAITCEAAGREIDLGGIGKGFALDQIKLLMEEWGIESALLSAGASTQLAFGSKTWPIELSGDQNGQSIELSNQALSASGIGIQGSHIVSPISSDEPSYHFKRAWILQPSAAMADAWTTALMLIDPEQLQAFEAPENTLYFETETGIQSLQAMQASND